MSFAERLMACPTTCRFWEVAMGTPWTDAERDHIDHCPGCQAVERMIGADCARARQRRHGSIGIHPLAGTVPEATREDPSASSRFGTIGIHQIEGNLDLADLPRPFPGTGESASLDAPDGGRDPFGVRLYTDNADFASSELPTRLGRYMVMRMLAKGGMGTVYLACDEELNRTVALKVSPACSGLADRSRLDRFLREARVVASLDHPAVVPIHEVGQAGNSIFISSQYVDGIDLQQRVQNEGALPWREAASLIERISGGVQHAHERGIIHRDIKPSNILIDQVGQPFLADFGLARSFDDDDEATITREGVIIGTPTYMAPEQAMGVADSQGPAIDIYALGATLYTLLTGRPPFRGASAIDTLRQAVETDAASPRTVNPTVSAELDSVCMKAMARDPHRRYPTARAFGDDLRAVLSGAPPDSRPRQVPRITALFLRTRMRIATGILFTALLAELALVYHLAWPGREAARGVGGPVGVASLLNASFPASTVRSRNLEREVEDSTRRILTAAERTVITKPNDNAARHDLARALLALGNVEAARGSPENASVTYRKAIALLVALTHEQPGHAAYRLELAETSKVLNAALRALGRAGEALEIESQAAELSP